jgi:antitoxin component of MazEF toxin-antitoxin module
MGDAFLRQVTHLPRLPSVPLHGGFLGQDVRHLDGSGQHVHVRAMLSRDKSWEVIDRIAASLGVRREARYKWRERGKVPGRWHLAILQKARAEGLDLDHEALADFRRGAGKAKVAPRRHHHLWIESGGRLTIPRALLQDLELSVGDPVVLEIEGDALRLRSQKRVIAEIQALVRQHVPEGVSLVDELIAERRREAELE